MGVKYVLTGYEVLQAQAALRGTPPPRGGAQRGWLGWVLFLFLVAMLFVLKPNLLDEVGQRLIRPQTPRAHLVFGVVLLCVGWVLLIWTWSILIRLARSGRSGEVELIPDGLAMTGAGTRNEFTWQFFTGHVDTGPLLVLRRPDDLMTVIPKRAFADPAEFEQIRAAINQNVVGPVAVANR